MYKWMRSWTRPFALGATCATLGATTAIAQDTITVASPDGRNSVGVAVREGRLYYMLKRDGRPILLPSQLGFEFRGAPPLRDGLRITGQARNSFDQTWTQPWGEVARVRDHHNELRVSVAETAAPSRGSTWSSAYSMTEWVSDTSFPSSPRSGSS
jgi:Glycoside hydrolase 97.